MLPVTDGVNVGTVETFDEVLRWWRHAEAQADVRTLDRLLDAAFQGDGPLGYVLGKTQWLDRYRTGDLVVEKVVWTAIEVRVHHSTAVGSGIQTQLARYRGADWSGSFACTVVAVRVADRWSIVNVQLGRASRPGG
jgi:hypothetical protein